MNNKGRIFIAGLLLLCLVVGLAILPFSTFAEPVDTYQTGWRVVRATNSEDGASFAAVYDLTGVGTTNGSFASKDTATVALKGAYHIRPTGYAPLPVSAGSKWVFAFSGECFNDVDDTFAYTLVGWSQTNGMLQVICEGTGTLGTQAVGSYPDETDSDAFGRTVSVIDANYTHATETFVDSADAGSFSGAIVGMMARVTGTGFTNEIVNITTVTDANTIVCDITTSSGNGTDATVQFNVAFWADTLVVTDPGKWSSDLSPDPNSIIPGSIGVANADGNNNVANLIVDLKGLEYIQFIIHDADASTGEQAGNVTVFGRPY